MGVTIGSVVFDVPGPSLETYGRNAGAIADLYAELLGMRRLSRGDWYRECSWPADEASATAEGTSSSRPASHGSGVPQ